MITVTLKNGLKAVMNNGKWESDEPLLRRTLEDITELTLLTHSPAHGHPEAVIKQRLSHLDFLTVEDDIQDDAPKDAIF